MHKTLCMNDLIEWHAQIREALKGSGVSIAFAGGCVRDLICKRPVKDLDLIVSFDDEDTEIAETIENTVVELDKLLRLTCKPARDEGRLHVDTSASSSSSEFLYTVWKYKEAFGMYPMDILFVTEPIKDYIETEFDFAICQAWVGYGGLHTTRGFWRDYHAQTLTYLQKKEYASTDETKRKSCLPHAQRLLAKFEGWKLRGFTVS